MPSTNNTHHRRLARQLAAAENIGYQKALQRVTAAASAGKLPAKLDAAGMTAALEQLQQAQVAAASTQPVFPGRVWNIGSAPDGIKVAFKALRRHHRVDGAAQTAARVPVIDELRTAVEEIDDDTLLIGVAGAFLELTIASCIAGNGQPSSYLDGGTWAGPEQLFQFAQMLQVDTLAPDGGQDYFGALSAASDAFALVAQFGPDAAITALGRLDRLERSQRVDAIVRLGQLAYITAFLVSKSRNESTIDRITGYQDVLDGLGTSYLFNHDLDTTTVRVLGAGLTGDAPAVGAALAGVSTTAAAVIAERAAVLVSVAASQLDDPDDAVDAALSLASGQFPAASDFAERAADVRRHLTRRDPFTHVRDSGDGMAEFLSQFEAMRPEHRGAFLIVLAVACGHILTAAAAQMDDITPNELIGTLASEMLVSLR